MKTSMYFNYTTRSLLRGGQRTVLAVFCVAVGVMAIVALQLVGVMINNALTSNVRDANGGDVAVSSRTRPFTAVTSATGSTSNLTSITNSFDVKAVNPNSFPIVTPPTFVDPSNGSISSLLSGNGGIVDKTFADQYNKKVGDTISVHVGTATGGNERVLDVKIAGIVAYGAVRVRPLEVLRYE